MQPRSRRRGCASPIRISRPMRSSGDEPAHRGQADLSLIFPTPDSCHDRAGRCHAKCYRCRRRHGRRVNSAAIAAPQLHQRITAAYASIILRAASEHDIFIRDANAGNLVQRNGYHLLHRDPAALETAVAVAETMREAYGVKFRLLTADELTRAEPGLKHAAAGAIHWQQTWTVSDPGDLVTAYADLLRHRGGTVVRGDAA